MSPCMSDRDHSSAIAFLDKRRRERITVGNSDQTIQIPENPELRAAIADAIEKLNPVPGADTAFAVRYVMLTIYLCSGNTSPQRAAPLSQIQKQLLGFANALIAAGTAAANLSGAAIEALNAEKSARGASTWSRVNVWSPVSRKIPTALTTASAPATRRRH